MDHDKQKSQLKQFTRGGQITLHNIRMFLQIMNKVFLIAAALLFLIWTVMLYLAISSYEWYVLQEYLLSHIIPYFQTHPTTKFVQPNGETITVSYHAIAKSTVIEHMVYRMLRKSFMCFIAALIPSILSFWGISTWLRGRGEKQTEHTLLKGDRILSAAETTFLIERQAMASSLTLAQLPLIKNSETSHLLFSGTIGSGKSNAIKELMEQIRARGERAIIYDKSCNFMQEFYDPGKDVLLNPLDKRSASWDLWQECRDAADFDSIAAAQIPMASAHDPFWVNAARIIFSVTAHTMRNDPDRCIMKLLKTILTVDLDQLQSYLKGTEAETLVSDKIEKTAISIKSVLATYLRSLKYVRENNQPFSVREWVQNEQAGNWLFVTSLGDRHETLKPLITTWLDIAINSLLSLVPNVNRRIWIILDELPSLQQLPYFTQVLSESRKFGGCVVAGIQNYAQLTKLYGQDGGKEISSLFNTRFMFRQPDPEMAKWTASNFGEAVVEEVREGMSYGANQIRDGVSINRIETRKPLISFSEVMSLGNLFAYVRLAGHFPIAKVGFQYKERPAKNIGFLAREDAEDGERMIDELLDSCMVEGGAVSAGDKLDMIPLKKKAIVPRVKKSVAREKVKTKLPQPDDLATGLFGAD